MSTNRRRGTFYVRHAVVHPIHAAVVVCLPFAVFFVGSVSAFFACALIVGEMALICGVARLPVFRQWVDEREQALHAAVAAKKRLQLLMRFNDAHKEEFERLEGLAARTRERLQPTASAQTTEDCLGMMRLLCSYASGATTFCAAQNCLAATDRNAIEADIAMLSTSAISGRTNAIRTIAAERLCVARMRAARWDCSRDHLDVIHEQLALIADVIRLMYQHSGAPAHSTTLRAEAERALAGVTEGEVTVSELLDLLVDDDVLDPEVLAAAQRAATKWMPPPALVSASHVRDTMVAADESTKPVLIPA